MRCEAAQRLLSEAMDEPVGAGPKAAEARAHAGTCSRCSAYRAGAWRVRELARFGVAPSVPDLAPAIMTRIRSQTVGAREPRRARPRWVAPVRGGAFVRPLAAGLAAGLVIGFVLTAGGVVPRRALDRAALAASIPERLVRAAVALRGYQATMDLTEIDWTKAVPRRTFVADIAFRAPEDFWVRIRDTTRYPSPAWPRNDLTLETDGRTWRETGPNPCPRAALPACPTSGAFAREIIGRPPFDPDTPMPTDVIVPMTVLAAADRVRLTGEGRVAGRDALSVELAYQDATPLFDSIRFLGSWRPFFPTDRVVVWLDRSTWFPLAYRVYPDGSPDRAAWASNQGLPPERAGRALFSATVRSISTVSPPASSFAMLAGRGPRVEDEGFEDARAAAVGEGMAPRGPQGLRLVRAGTIGPGPGRPYRRSILAYAGGLAWLTVCRVQGWTERASFGVGAFAQRVKVGTGSLALYEPATSDAPRKVALHTARGEFLLVSNLPRAELLSIAATLPVRGLPLPASWLVHRWKGGTVEQGLTVTQAAAGAGFPLLLPASLPDAYAPAAAGIVRTDPVTGSPGSTGVTVAYFRADAELDGEGIRLYQATGQTLPPPTGADQVEVDVRGVIGRWSPVEHRLEWVEAGRYVSVTGPGLDLSGLRSIAESLREGL